MYHRGVDNPEGEGDGTSPALDVDQGDPLRRALVDGRPRGLGKRIPMCEERGGLEELPRQPQDWSRGAGIAGEWIFLTASGAINGTLTSHLHM